MGIIPDTSCVKAAIQRLGQSNVFGCCEAKVGVKAARAGKKGEGEADGRKTINVLSLHDELSLK